MSPCWAAAQMQPLLYLFPRLQRPFLGQSVHPCFGVHTPICIYVFFHQPFTFPFKELLWISACSLQPFSLLLSLCPFRSQPQAFQGAFIIIGCPWSPLECVAQATQSPISSVVEPFKSLFVLYVNDSPLRPLPPCMSQPPCSPLCFLPLDLFFLVTSLLFHSVSFSVSLFPCPVLSCMLFLNKLTHV